VRIADDWELPVRRDAGLELAVKPRVRDTTPMERDVLIERIPALAACRGLQGRPSGSAAVGETELGCAVKIEAALTSGVRLHFALPVGLRDFVLRLSGAGCSSGSEVSFTDTDMVLNAEAGP
jgi:hypothetical protein